MKMPVLRFCFMSLFLRVAFLIVLGLLNSPELRGNVLVSDTLKPTLFMDLYHLSDGDTIYLNTNIDKLIRHADDKDYQACVLSIPSFDKIQKTFDVRVRTRGNMRKRVCRIPPLKIDFNKGELGSLGWEKLDKLKLVFPCNNTNSYGQSLLKEFLVYEMFEAIDSNALLTKRLHVVVSYNNDEKFNFPCLLVEDEDHYLYRKGAVMKPKGRVRPITLDRQSFLKMAFFQYLIGNTDWAIEERHNVELVKLPSIPKIIPVPYDFDYAGIVGNRYAVPHQSLPITSVEDRYFFSFYLTEREYFRMVNFFKIMESTILNVIEEASYLSDKSRKECRKYASSFFRLLKRPQSLKSEIIKRY